MDGEDPQIDETQYLHTHMAIPLRTKSKLIIALDIFSYTYLFKDNDRNILLKYVDRKQLDSTLFALQNEKKLNPCTNSIPFYNFLLTFSMFLLYLIFLYLNFGIIVEKANSIEKTKFFFFFFFFDSFLKFLPIFAR